MKEAWQFCQKNKLISSRQRIGVAVSGGVDSMALLHWLNQLSKEQDFFVSAITIDHCIREESAKDNQMVVEFCNQHQIKVNCFKVDAVKFAKENKQSLETAARNVRYGVFDSLLNKKIVDKIALAHHQEDQAETVLMNLFRGAGSKGMAGMQPQRDDYIRPFLTVEKQKILQYAKKHNLPIAIDETNFQNDWARNFLRNEIMPLIKQQWQGAVKNIVSFAEINSCDNDYFNKTVKMQAATFFDNVAKISTSCFLNHPSIYARQLFLLLEQIGWKQNIERKHLNLIKDFAFSGQSGKKINLPDGLSVVKEYDFLVFENKQEKVVEINIPFKQGKFKAGNVVFEVSAIKKIEEKKENELFLDVKKVPKQAVWRLMQPNDTFLKFGGGTKTLKAFLVDKKISARERKVLPVLTFKNDVLVVLGVEISQSVKVDENTKQIFKITKL